MHELGFSLYPRGVFYVRLGTGHKTCRTDLVGGRQLGVEMLKSGGRNGQLVPGTDLEKETDSSITVRVENA